MNRKNVLTRFKPGRIVATPGILEKADPAYLSACIVQHCKGNWGLVDEEDWHANDRAIHEGTRLLSSYALPDDSGKFWIITEADRSVTTLLLPSEY